MIERGDLVQVTDRTSPFYMRIARVDSISGGAIPGQYELFFLRMCEYFGVEIGLQPLRMEQFSKYMAAADIELALKRAAW